MHEPVSDLPNLLFLDHALKASKMLSGVSELSGGHCRVDVCRSEMPVLLLLLGLPASLDVFCVSPLQLLTGWKVATCLYKSHSHGPF